MTIRETLSTIRTPAAPAAPARTPAAPATPATDHPQARGDSWTNLASGMGVLGKDRRLQAAPTLTLVDRASAETLWRGSDMAARLIEIWPYEMTREGWEIMVDGEMAEEVTSKLDELDLQAKIYEALTYARAYGGGALLLGADDGQRDLAQPLVPERVRSFEWINVLLPEELTPQTWYTNPTAEKYGEPELYLLSPALGGASQVIHETRIVRFDGVIVSKRHRQEAAGGWGDSILTRVLSVLRDFDGAWDGAGVIAENFAQAVMKMKGLAQLLASEDPNDAEAFRRRVAAVIYSQSMVNVTLLDGEGEDYERKTTNLTGFPDLLDRFAQRLAAAGDLPLTRLMGVSPGGLNATGDSDIRLFYDSVKARQTRDLRKPITRVADLVGVALGKPLPPGWMLRFCPLWQETKQERALHRKTVLEGTQIAVGGGWVTPEEAAKSHFGGDQFSEDLHLDTLNREAMAEEDPPDENAPGAGEVDEPPEAE